MGWKPSTYSEIWDTTSATNVRIWGILRVQSSSSVSLSWPSLLLLPEHLSEPSGSQLYRWAGYHWYWVYALTALLEFWESLLFNNWTLIRILYKSLVLSLYLSVEPRPRNTDHIDTRTVMSPNHGLPGRGTWWVEKQQIIDEQSIIWCTGPSQQMYIAMALHHAHIDCHIYHSDLTAKERRELVCNFTTNPDKYMVLICSYYVNAAGSNLQYLCRNSHQFDTPTSQALSDQGNGRVLRVMWLITRWEETVSLRQPLIETATVLLSYSCGVSK